MTVSAADVEHIIDLVDWDRTEDDQAKLLAYVRQPGADLAVRGDRHVDGRTIGHHAARCDYRDVLSAWLAAGGDADALDNENRSIGDTAVERHATDCLRIWARSGADLGVEAFWGLSPGHRAIELCHPDCLRVWLAAGGDLGDMPTDSVDADRLLGDLGLHIVADNPDPIWRVVRAMWHSLRPDERNPYTDADRDDDLRVLHDPDLLALATTAVSNCSGLPQLDWLGLLSAYARSDVSA